MLEKYQESYEYLKSETGNIKSVVSQNKIGFWERIQGVPGFFREGFAHLSHVKVVFLIAFLKLFALALVTAISVVTTFSYMDFVATSPLVQDLYGLFSNALTLDQLQNILQYGGIVLLWAPYLIIILLISGTFNGAMGAATYLHAKGEDPKLVLCLDLALQQAPTIWKFWLIQKLFLILTSSRQREGALTSFAKGAIRQAWFFGTAGVMPAILNGKSLLEAAKRSIQFLKTKPVKLISLILIKQITLGLLIFAVMACLFAGMYLHLPGLQVLTAFFLMLVFIISPLYISMLYMLYEKFLEEKKYKLNVKRTEESHAFIDWLAGIYIVPTLILLGLGAFF